MAKINIIVVLDADPLREDPHEVANEIIEHGERHVVLLGAEWEDG